MNRSEPSTHEDDERHVAGIVARTRAAFQVFKDFSQEQVDDVVTGVAWAICKAENAERLATLESEGSRMGNVADKTLKNINRVFGTVAQMQGQKSVGVLDVDDDSGITRIAKPKGVFGVFVPVTNTVPGLAQNALALLKGRNAAVFCAPTKTRRAASLAVQLIRDQIAKVGAPEDVITLLESPTRGMREELMKQSDVLIATGGAGLVQAVHRSGRPALGAGPGNAVTILDGTCRVVDAVTKIVRGKTFDFATSCSSESTVLVHASAYDEAMREFQRWGGYVVRGKEKARLSAALFPDGRLNEELVGRSPETLARAAQIDAPAAAFFLVEEDGQPGPGNPFSGEKLSVVLAVHRYDSFDEAIEKVRAILRYQGSGHSCGIHTARPELALRLGEAVDVCRVLINQVHGLGNSGSFGNGMPFTATLGCGSWGGNSMAENMTWKHCINITHVSRPIPEKVPTEAQVFGAYHARYGR